MTPSIVELAGVAQHYAWGDPESIPSMLGVPADGQPWAELWFGAHPTAPSPAGVETLDHLIEHDPLDALGATTIERFGNQLPFLLKVLAAAEPLSLQAHPTREQAIAGYAREEAAGIALDDPARTYRDQNHKPEVLCAITPFAALCGFREPSASAALLRGLEVDGLSPVIDALAGGDLGAAIAWLLADRTDRDGRDSRAIADAVAAACERAGLAWTTPIAAAYPGDLGLVTALLLHHVVLQPGDAIYLDAGTLHAYLHGTGIELMASSDNVLRGGLTPKHVDRTELQHTLVLAPSEPRIVRPEHAGGAMDVWRTPAPDFQLWRIETGASAEVEVEVQVDGPEIVLCIGGTATLTNTEVSVVLASGDAAFVAANAGSYVAETTGSLYRATVG